MDKEKKMNNTIKREHGVCNRWLTMVCCGLLCMGCSEDTVTPDKAPLTGRPVIVDYTVGETQTRSVSHEALPAHKRIKSLVYLLYNDGGELVKQREIPDISGMKEGDWPMTRATMTWAQREALKDTLKQGQNYTAVFVANADKSLFGGEEVLHLTQTQDEETSSLTLDEVYLSLPTTTAFDDHNMFYLCVCGIQPNGNDRDTHYDCPVTLQRVVSRTDFFSDDYPAWGTDFTNGKIRAFTDEKVCDVLLPGNTTEEKPLDIKTWLGSFTDDFAYFSKGYIATLATFQAWIADFTRVLNNLDYSGYINSLSEADKTAIQEQLYNSCLQNARLKGLWQPWKDLQAKVVYSSRADRFYVSGRTAKVGDDTATESLSPFLDMIQQETTTADGSTITQNTFTLIGFGENAGTADGNELNKMTALRLYTSVSATSSVTEIPMTDNVQSFADQGGNERVQLVYCPIKTLEYNTSFTTGLTYNLEPVNIKNGIKKGMGNYALHSSILDDFFKTEDCKNKYGESLEKFILQITLPDLSQEGALTVTPEWSVKTNQ